MKRIHANDVKGQATKPVGPPVDAQSGSPRAAPAGSKASSLGPFEVFDLCIERAKNLIKLHTAAHGKRSKPEKYMADAHRAAIVLAVSALDAFVRTFVVAKARQLLADRSRAIPPALVDQIKRFLKDDELLDAARKDDLLDRVEKAFRSDFERRSFQGTKNIAEYMKMVGYDDIFHEVAIKAKLNEDSLRGDLDKFTKRRHAIAHRGDYDLDQNPPKENVITKAAAEACIKMVTTIAKHINAIE
jgi:hypothetical protein